MSDKLCNKGTLYSYNTQLNTDYDIIVGNDYGYAKINNRSFNYGVITMIVIAFIIVILFILYFIYEYLFPRTVHLRDLRNPIVSPSFFNASSYISEPACEANSRAQWNVFKGECECKPPYEGDMCELDVLDEDYGKIFTSSDILFESLGIENTSNLSICTQLCDLTTECNSVDFFNNRCNMIAEITSRGREDTRIFYIRKDSLNSINYLDRVFFHNGELTLNVINTDRSSTHVRIFTNRVYILYFYPENVINSGNLTGIISVFPFEVEDFDNMLLSSRSNNWYIVVTGDEVNIPIEWSDKSMWVMYSEL